MNIYSEINSNREIIKKELSREFAQEVARKLGANLEKDEPQGFRSEGMVFGDVPPRMKSSEYLNAAVGWVYSCVSAIADAIAEVQPRLYKTDKDGNLEEQQDHPILDVLTKINNYTSRYDHFWLTQQYLELTGEAPWFVARGESGTGDPTDILLLQPDKLTIVKNDSQDSADPIKGYRYRTDQGKKIDIDINELIFLKFPDPVNTFRGKGTLQAASLTVDVDMFSEEYNRRFFFNSARPDSVLTTDQKLTPRQKESLRADLKRLYQGRENAHKTAILESGLDWKSMSISQKDMDFLEQQRFTMTKILSIFRVPKSIIAVSDDVNLANAKVAEYVFAKRTIKPKLERIYSQLNEFFVPMFKNTDGLFLAYDNPVPQDTAQDVAKYDSALGKGWMTINEVRAEQNLEDVGPEGDVIYQPFSMAPLGMGGGLNSGNGSSGDNVPPSDQNSAKMANRAIKVGVKSRLNHETKQDVINRSAGGYLMALRRLSQQGKKEEAKKKAVEKIEETERKIDIIVNGVVKNMIKKKRAKSNADIHNKKEVYAQMYLKAADHYERKFYQISANIFKNQKQRVLDKLGEKAINPDDYLFDEKDEAINISKYYKPVMKSMIKSQGNQAGILIGIGDAAFDDQTKRVQNYLRSRSYKFSFEMTQTTNDMLGNQLKEAVKLGESIPQIRSRVSTLFDGMEKYRSERIARSEVIRGSNFAADEMYQQSGVVSGKEWLTTEDDATCEFCAPLDGKLVDLDNNFFNKNDNVRGADGGVLDLDYEDVGFPPLHSNCRCTIIPVIK